MIISKFSHLNDVGNDYKADQRIVRIKMDEKDAHSIRSEEKAEGQRERKTC